MDRILIMLQRVKVSVDKLSEISRENAVAIARLEAGVERHQETLVNYDKQASVKHEALVVLVGVIKKDVEKHSFIVKFAAAAIAIMIGGIKLFG